MTDAPQPREGMPSPELDESEFRARYLEHFADPAFDPLRAELDAIAGVAGDGYSNNRDAARTLLRAVQEQRSGRLIDAGEGLEQVRRK